MSEKIITLYIKRGKLEFSCGHFVLLSATERETLHGHRFELEIELKAKLNAPGLTLDYRVFESHFMPICQRLNLRCLMPGRSPYLNIEETDQHYHITFNHQTMQLLKQDVIILPMTNVTIEELSQWFLDQLMLDRAFLEKYGIQFIAVTAFNSPEHGARAEMGV